MVMSATNGNCLEFCRTIKLTAFSQHVMQKDNILQHYDCPSSSYVKKKKSRITSFCTSM